MSLVSYDISSDSSDDGCQIENQEHHDVIQNKDKPKRVNSDDTSLENRKKYIFLYFLYYRPLAIHIFCAIQIDIWIFWII